MIWVSMLTFFAAVAAVFYALHRYSSERMRSDRAAQSMVLGAAFLATSFLLLVAYTVEGGVTL